LGAPNFLHDITPISFLARGQRFNPSDGPAIAGDQQRLASFKLVQDRLGFLVQLFRCNYAHFQKSNTFKVSPQGKVPTSEQSLNRAARSRLAKYLGHLRLVFLTACKFEILKARG
jgi:hypothetical protein